MGESKRKSSLLFFLNLPLSRYKKKERLKNTQSTFSWWMLFILRFSSGMNKQYLSLQGIWYNIASDWCFYLAHIKWQNVYLEKLLSVFFWIKIIVFTLLNEDIARLFQQTCSCTWIENKINFHINCLVIQSYQYFILFIRYEKKNDSSNHSLMFIVPDLFFHYC
jgi:hypothetical protein